MALTQAEKERLRDSRMKLQSVASSLKHIDSKEVPGFDEIQECIEGAEESLKGAIKRSGD
jgi:hypothetical protein